MGMTAVATGLVAALVGGGQVYQGIQAEKARKDARDQADAQKAEMDKQAADALKSQDASKATDDQTTKAKADTASVTQSAAFQAIRSAMSASSSAGGTILTGPQGAAPAPITTKTLLGA